MVLDRYSYSSPGSKVLLSLEGEVSYLGHLILKEIIMIMFIKYRKPFKVRGDMKVSRKQKTGPESLPSRC